MDPVRRVLFLVLFASVLAAEPTYAQAGNTDGPTVSLSTRWAQRLAVVLRRTIPSTTAVTVASPRRVAARPDVVEAQVAAVHPALLPHSFRLPPPF